MKKNMIFVIMLLVLFTTGCSFLGLDKEEKETAKQYEKLAKSLATDYIKNKYGFEPKIVKAVVDTGRIDLSPLYLTGDVFVEMKYNGTKFYVKASDMNKQARIDGDTYQNDIIRRDCIKKLAKLFNQEPLYFDSNIDSEYFSHKEYYYDYYDGTNIEKYFVPFEIGLLNYSTVNSADIESQLNELIPLEYKYIGEFLKIYNLKSLEAYEQYKKIKAKSYLGVEAIYFSDYYVGGYNNIKHEIVDVKDDEIILVARDYALKKTYSFDDYSRETLGGIDFMRVSENDKAGTEYLVNAFKFNNRLSYVYLKKDSYKKYRNLDAVYYCKSRNYYKIDSFDDLGAYYFANIDADDCAEGYLLIKTNG